MRIGRSYAPILQLFREKWSTSLLPRALILEELELAGTPVAVRTMDEALAKVVRNGELRRVESHDGGALFCLESYALSHPEAVELARREPMRSLNAENPARAKAILKKWQGAHTVRASTRLKVDTLIDSFPAAHRKRIRGPNSVVVYPAQYRDARTCRKCGAFFLSVKARRNHESREHTTLGLGGGVQKPGSASASRAK